MGKTNSDRLIGSLAKVLAAQPPEGVSDVESHQIERILGIYYRHIDPNDLAEYEAGDLLGALIAHWHLMRRRRPDKARVRVYNPDQEEHGWRSPDTVVEVVSQDMPFLVDSVSWALNRAGLTIHLTLHPVFAIARDSKGLLISLRDPKTEGSEIGHEAVLRFHVDRQPSDKLDSLEQAVSAVLADVRSATGDWVKMRQTCAKSIQDIAELAGGVEDDDLVEAKAFLNWMVNDHFLFLASCTLAPQNGGATAIMRCNPGSGLGLFGVEESGARRADEWVADLGADIVESGKALMVTKANARSNVHRPAYMDLVAVKQRDEQGNVIGLSCFIGLFSSSVYSTPPRQIPLLRKKIDRVFSSAQVAPNSHSGRSIANILDNFPRDTLFQIDDGDLLESTLGVLSLQERQRTRLFVVRDPFQRFYSCLVYLPRERYNRETRIAIQRVLSDALGGCDVVFETHFSESILARIYFVIVTPPGSIPDYDIADLESQVIAETLTWQDGLQQALFARMDEGTATQYLQCYGEAFPSGFREDFHPRIAVNDILRIEQLRKEGGLCIHLYHPIVEGTERVHVRLYALQDPVPLSEVIPVLEHMGLQVFGERPYCIRHPQGNVWIHDFETREALGAERLTSSLNKAFTETFEKIWRADIDDDRFNGLVLKAGIDWKEALLFRAYSRYLHQIAVPYAENYLVAVLHRYPAIVHALVKLFHQQFDPACNENSRDEVQTLTSMEDLLNDVESLDEDSILRRYLNLIQSTLRTNYYQTNAEGERKTYLALKVDPNRVTGMPKPLPMFEIFVYSRQMEGVHMRGGRVARGGLRWSDRMEDYRTEILGLMKAQMVKNTVIVPVGSKGGFVVKNSHPDDTREQRLEKGISCYQMLLRGMLDITDNLVGEQVVPPPLLVRRDDDDPYLVIAADKGTATFSDIANSVSAEYGFWLGDAFASGGSAGYDHKVMGITARGAWESVKRSFREISINIQTTGFTVVGIGDMSGDVFGNGMLLSRHIRLVAAFNHQHIFIDPEPDTEVSFAERERLFKRARSSWADYDRKAISKGGGVYARTAKSIAVEAEASKALGISEGRMAPNDVIRAILKAPVDLLWNGGIGTYVKATSESHADAHDKTNESLRVDAAELRCRVIGEGGNLGLTQLGRVEYAMRGGLVYTDAIDNSAGVDCSDHEVNIKILLDKVVADEDMTQKQRNTLLSQMTDDVARLVLADNYSQSQAISLVVADAADRLYEHARFMELLEQKGTFDRQLEGLPGKKALTERLALGRGLTKPEVAVLLAYSKMNYYEAILASDVPDDPYVAARLLLYFPEVLRERFSEQIHTHRLRREIVATAVAGSIANQVGPGIGFRVREEVGTDIASVARAYLVVSEIFATDALRERVEDLDNQVAASVQIEMLGVISGFLETTLTAVLRAYRGCLDMTELKTRFEEGVVELVGALPNALASHGKADYRRKLRHLTRAGVDKDLAASIAGLGPLADALDIIDVAQQSAFGIPDTAWIYSALSHTLDLDWIEEGLANLAVQTHWHLLARTKLQAALKGHRRNLAAQILCAREGRQSPREILKHWVKSNETMLHRHVQLIAEFKAGNIFDFAVMSLLVAGVGELSPSKPVSAPD